MAPEPPDTVLMIDWVGSLRERVRLLLGDRLEPDFAELARLARDIDEGRLNAISYLNHGKLQPRRVRRLREIGVEDRDPLEAA